MGRGRLRGQRGRQVWGAALAAALVGGSLAAAPRPAQAQSPPEQPPVPVEVTGATRIEYDAGTQRYTFQGPRVVIVRGTQRLEAPLVHYDAAARRAELPEGGTVSTPTMELSGDQITADLAARHLVVAGHVAARFLDQGLWTTLRAGRVVADDRPDLQLADATGDVVVMRDGEQLRADHLTYDRRTQQGMADGHVDLVRGTDRLRADRLGADLAAQEAEAEGHVMLDRGSEGVHGTADRATYSGRSRTAVLSGHAAVTRGQDVVTAERITVLLDGHTVIAEGSPRIVAVPEEPAPPSSGSRP